MKMQTKMKKQGDTLIVEIEGTLDFESNEPFRQSMDSIFTKFSTDRSPEKIVFDLEKLEFVGSSGISRFIKTLQEVSVRAHGKTRYCNVASEFQRMMKAMTDEELFEFFESQESARSSFNN